MRPRSVVALVVVSVLTEVLSVLPRVSVAAWLAVVEAERIIIVAWALSAPSAILTVPPLGVAIEVLGPRNAPVVFSTIVLVPPTFKFSALIAASTEPTYITSLALMPSIRVEVPAAILPRM